jgi:hypothetical protein
MVLVVSRNWMGSCKVVSLAGNRNERLVVISLENFETNCATSSFSSRILFLDLFRKAVSASQFYFILAATLSEFSFREI